MWVLRSGSSDKDLNSSTICSNTTMSKVSHS